MDSLNLSAVYAGVMLAGGGMLALALDLPWAGGIALCCLGGAAWMGLKFAIDNSDPSDFNDPGPPGAP